ncbi:hypothetical protein PG993_001763 [Apiospora rasikravindrae]|uniref:Uncharacterized protein n=1 Tax=Apiospora rasikravindrae TaxID=990691 RepID=A0ABR1UCB4_9PEZI
MSCRSRQDPLTYAAGNWTGWRPDVNVDFTFVQIGVKDGALDMEGNCGVMPSAVGPRAWDIGLVPGSTLKTTGPPCGRTTL